MICYQCGVESANKNISGIKSVKVGGCAYCGKDRMPLYPLRMFFVAGRYQVKRDKCNFGNVNDKDRK